MNVFINNNEFFTDNLTEKLKNKLSDITIKEISIKSDLVNFCTNSEVDLIVFDLNSTDDIQILKALQKKLFSKKIFSLPINFSLICFSLYFFWKKTRMDVRNGISCIRNGDYLISTSFI